MKNLWFYYFVKNYRNKIIELHRSIIDIGVFFVRGAYLYRRERKKGGSTSAAGAGPAKRTRHGFSDDGSSTSTQPDGKYNHNL